MRRVDVLAVLHLAVVWSVPASASTFLITVAADDGGLQNGDLLVGVVSVAAGLALSAWAFRSAVPLARTTPGLLLWTVLVTVLGVLGLLVGGLALLAVDPDVDIVEVGVLSGLPFGLAALTFVRRLLVWGVASALTLVALGVVLLI